MRKGRLASQEMLFIHVVGGMVVVGGEAMRACRGDVFGLVGRLEE